MEESFAAGLVGVTLDDRYRLDAVLGEGGMGAVFRATHLAMDRKVAVKLLKPHLTSDQTQRQRFIREARATFKVDSPHAVKVLDFGITPHRDYYMVLEYLDGRTVQRELEIDGVFTPKRAVHVARQALHALAAAHRSGLVHRDIKPDNLLLMRVGADPDYTKVLDFGVAKLMEGAARSEQSQLALTAIGMVFGTPEFMSPEQAHGHALDGRSDLYSLAATMFAMLTGLGLFDAGSAIEWLMHHARTPPPTLASVRAELAAYPELDALLQRCLAKHRDDRPASAEELDRLLAALEPMLDRAPGDRPDEPRPQPAAAAPASPSSYFAALPDPAAASTASIPPAAEPHPVVDSATTTGVLREVRGRRRGLGLALGALALVAAVGVTIGVTARRATAPRPAPARDALAAAGDGAPTAVSFVGVDATPAELVAPPPDAARDGAPADAARARPAEPTPTVAARNRAVEAHLAAADAALRAGNVLRAIAEADLALRAAPRNARARRLLGEALIQSGDTVKGCEYLRQLRRRHRACGDD